MNMRHQLVTRLASGVVLASMLALVSGCNETSSNATTAATPNASPRVNATRSIPSGTPFNVAIGSAITSENAQPGDSWSGNTTQPVSSSSGAVIASGSRVVGEVTRVTAAKRGDRAMLQLIVTRIDVNGRDQDVRASSDAIIAGSTRARNLGAIAGSAAVGALVGKQVGDGKNGAVGALIGGAAAAGVVANSKGWQVVLPAGTVMSFTLNQSVAVR